MVASKITNDIEQIKFVIDKVKTIVTYFKHSVVVADDLRKAQPVNNVLKLKQSVPTRWNSTYYMLERCTKLYEYVAPILLKSPKAPPMIDASELVLIKEILTILSPIEAVSKEIFGESYLTSSKVIPVINCLIKKIELLTPSTEEILALKGTLLAEIAKRFGAIKQSKLLAVSTILDPRFKRLHFNNPIHCTNAITFINQSIQLFHKETENVPLDTGNSSTPKINHESVWTYHEELAVKDSEKKTDTFSIDGDMDLCLKMYITNATLPLNSDPFFYWTNSNFSNSLKEAASKYLSVVATSVPSERLFSKTGRIITHSRNRLSGKKSSISEFTACR